MSAHAQTVLLALACTGALPPQGDLDGAASAWGRCGSDVLAELAEQDFLFLDDGDAVRAAYPFSLVPTRHQVVVLDGPTVWSMCAIDALGIAPMLGRSTTITSCDPVSGERILVRATPTAVEWDPVGAVVLVGCRPGPPVRPRRSAAT